MIKAAIIIERADISLGGAERSVYELTTQLAAMGVKVTTLAAKGNIKNDNFHILCNDVESKRVPIGRFGKALKTHFKENKYDIIHSTLPFAFANIYQPRGGSYKEAMIQNAASYENGLTAMLKRATHFLNYKRAALLRAEKKVCQSNNTIVAALSGYVKEHFEKHYGLDETRLRVIANGVKTDIEPNAQKAEGIRKHILKKLSMTEADEPVLMLLAANNFRLKGLGQLIKAMSLASKSNPQRPICLVIAGSGKEIGYKILARKLRVNHRVVFLGKLSSIQNALSVCDVAVLPSWYDPCSRFILEAISMSKPVITSRFNGASEAFTDGVHGQIVESPSDIEALAKAMLYFSETNNIIAASQAIANDELADKVSIKRHAAELTELYNTILQNKD